MRKMLAVLIAIVTVLLGGAVASASSVFTAEGVASGELGHGRNVFVSKITIEPGGYVDWHTHPGLTLGVVTGGGTMTIVTTGCNELTYPTGTAFTAPKAAHTARNFSSETFTAVVTFMVKGTAPTVFVDPARDVQLDERCGFAD